MSKQDHAIIANMVDENNVNILRCSQLDFSIDVNSAFGDICDNMRDVVAIKHEILTNPKDDKTRALRDSTETLKKSLEQFDLILANMTKAGERARETSRELLESAETIINADPDDTSSIEPGP